MHFYTHEAVPLSKIVIFTGSLSSFILNTKLHHPDRKSKALDYNLIIVIVPNLLFGTILGVTLNRILPNVVIIFCLTIVLLYNTYKTIKMGVKQYNEENERQINLIRQNETERNASSVNPSQPNSKNQNDISNNDYNKFTKDIENEIAKDNKILRWDKLKYVIIPFIIMFILSILRESNLVPKCSIMYWVLFTIFFLFALITNVVTYFHIEKEHYLRVSMGFPYNDKDIIWNTNKCIKMGILGLISGFIAGVIGIGGGVVLGPILLGQGIYPIVSTVTTNFLVLLTSSSTSVQFMLNGMMNYEYALISIVFSIIGSYVGTKVIHYYFHKTGRESLLIFALVLVIGSSALILPISSIISTINDINKGVEVLRFNSPCNE